MTAVSNFTMKKNGGYAWMIDGMETEYIILDGVENFVRIAAGAEIELTYKSSAYRARVLNTWCESEEYNEAVAEIKNILGV